jgi:FAD/FMN-containing dehydrogenase
LTNRQEKDMTLTDNRSTRIGEATLAEFAAGLRGTAVRPVDEDYDHVRSIWNGAHDRRPAVIARCAGVADVIRTIDLARSEGLPLAVRGGGHSIAGFSTVDGGIVADLSPMKGIQVDPERRRVVAQAGCTWKDLDAETQQFGLAVTGGLVSSTGIAGFTTGGGIGWLMRQQGLASDNLVGADVVTADGQLVHASADEHVDLFWGLRGGGGNFGVVTSFEYQLHEVGTVLAGLVFYPAEEAEQVLRGYRAACAAAPDELTTLLNLTTAPPVPFLPESVHGKPIVAVGGCWSGDLDAGEAATAPFRSLGTVITDVFGANPYVGGSRRSTRSGRAGCTTTSAPRSSARPTTPRCGCCGRGSRPCRTGWPRSTCSTSAAPWAGSRARRRRSRSATTSSSSTWWRGRPPRTASRTRSSGRAA